MLLLQVLPGMDRRRFQVSIPGNSCPSKTFLEEMHKKLFIFRIRPHLPTIHFQVILWASGSLVLIKIWHLELWRNNHIGYIPNGQLSLGNISITMIWLQIECNSRIYARKSMNLSKNTLKGGEIWQLK